MIIGHARRTRASRSDAWARTAQTGSARTTPDRAHYDLVARALRYLDAHQEDQPSLEETAAHVGLSPAHFQRLFSRLVGVSPKRYLQHLTLMRARRYLAERASVLDATYAAGLSAPSRLHDLFLRWEAMTPGTFARGGAGIEIAWGFRPSPFGEVLAMATPRGLAGLAFTAEMGREATFADMAARWPEARLREDPAAVAPLVEAAFVTPGARRRPLTLAPLGGPFQIKVWEALLAIPEGAVTTYATIARAIGRPGAARAVGRAVGQNPIALLIPCHRVLRRDGGLGGYHWGLGVKRALLAAELARAATSGGGGGG